MKKTMLLKVAILCSCLNVYTVGGDSLRLVGGIQPYRGIVQVQHDGVWGTICNGGWNDTNASFVCKMLGYPYKGTMISSTQFQSSSDRVLLDHLNCDSNSRDITNCTHDGWGNTSCSNSDVIAVWCFQGDNNVILVDGNSANEGRVEIYHNDSLGTVCDDHFGSKEADVTCKMIGYRFGGIANKRAKFGQGSGQILLDDVNCSGDESNIDECMHSGWTINDCTHSEDVGVTCYQGCTIQPVLAYMYYYFVEAFLSSCSLLYGGVFFHLQFCSTCKARGRLVACYEMHEVLIDDFMVTDKMNISNQTGDGEWGPWSTCTKSCGGGSQTRYVDCGRDVTLCAIEIGIADCNEEPCPIDGKWGEWEKWTSCSVTCGYSVQTRSRDCNDPSPNYGGKNCSGDNLETKECYAGIMCPVNGAWTSWTNWTDCSVTCENGTQVRMRECSDPEPEYGGSNCSGNDTEKQTCYTEVVCPVSGGWSTWGNWSTCSVSCESGTQTRTRICDSPAPAYNGQNCTGKSEDTKRCDIEINCPVDGGWGNWSDWTPCPVTCDNGTMGRTRNCDAPAPKHNGQKCKGNTTEYEDCFTGISCPVHGGWGPWLQWSSCSADCDCGTQIRNRSCNNPEPIQNGSRCIGSDTEAKFCMADKFCQASCGIGYFLCGDQKTCIEKPMSCDGIQQCPDGDDEVGCLELFFLPLPTVISSEDMQEEDGSYDLSG